MPYLELPNTLHPKCPTDQEEVLHTAGEKPAFDFEPRTHMELMEGEVEPAAGKSFYLLGRPARLELLLTRLVESHLLGLDYEAMANPDLAKSVVVEGCGVNFTDEEGELALKQVMIKNILVYVIV